MLELFWKLLPGAIVGGALASSLLMGVNYLYENPSIKAETRLLVEAETRKFTEEAIDEITSNADKAKAMRVYCKGIGKPYLFAEVRCAE